MNKTSMVLTAARRPEIFKAVERHAALKNLANQLAKVYGERPVIPEWARAEITCPGYYA